MTNIQTPLELSGGVIMTEKRTIRQWRGKVLCWFGFHKGEWERIDTIVPILNLHGYLKLRICTRCGHIQSERFKEIQGIYRRTT